MRKRHISPTRETVASGAEGWLDIEPVAVVEITSEDKNHPIEAALALGRAGSWRAAESGSQTIRLVFDAPQNIQRIALVFEEAESARTQEFVLRWSSDSGKSFREIVRQQWTFSPPQTTRQIEEYQVDLAQATVLEMTIVPNISGGADRASLTSLRLK